MNPHFDPSDHGGESGDEFVFTCKFCGRPSAVDPSDQMAPPDYCHESDHLPVSR